MASGPIFQMDKRHIDIYWSQFTDVESLGYTTFHTGIEKYEVSIGEFINNDQQTISSIHTC